jgi:type I restriction enzyme S subunit
MIWWFAIHVLIPMTPIEEQKEIVEVVSQLFAEVDQLETITKKRISLKEDFVTSALKQLNTGDTSTKWVFLKEHFSTFFTEKANIKKLRESILQLAVQGKLTSYWRISNPDVENAKVLLEQIKKRRR